MYLTVKLFGEFEDCFDGEKKVNRFYRYQDCVSNCFPACCYLGSTLRDDGSQTSFLDHYSSYLFLKG